ncbi:hypothetical protein [Exiguobacterium sp.]|uniref:hypothetical protein n=1 Tax=Exiguobacterium sp. TaxID=44751 RepID=UPI00307DB039
MRYYIELYDDSNDRFEFDEDNVGTVKILDGGDEVLGGNYRVMLTLSKNGMIGLGTELIRMAHQFEIGRHDHIEPMVEDFIVQRMGVFLTPESREIIVACGTEREVDSYFPTDI